MLSIIIPANNEEFWIGRCLDALLGQTPDDLDGIEIIVAANGCMDSTVAVARDFEDRACARGWKLIVLDIANPGKPNALNEGDRIAAGEMRVYIDADVVCGPDLLHQLRVALDRSDPVYASGKFAVSPARSWTTRRYAELWTRLPFMTTGVPGGGLFAVNAAGRARWGAFPDIIADDRYVRLQFAPEERVGVPATYMTPLAEGFAALVRVRRRWDAGNRELRSRYPALLKNDGTPPVRPAHHLRLFLAMPTSYIVYVAVRISGWFGGPQRDGAWSRGR